MPSKRERRISMDKSNKELAVDLAKSALMAMAQMSQNNIHKPLSGGDVENILKSCYLAVCSLDERE